MEMQEIFYSDNDITREIFHSKYENNYLEEDFNAVNQEKHHHDEEESGVATVEHQRIKALKKYREQNIIIISRYFQLFTAHFRDVHLLTYYFAIRHKNQKTSLSDTLCVPEYFIILLLKF